MHFRSFQSRILFFFLGLFILVQAVTFIAVNKANIRNATIQIKGELKVTGNVFEQLIADHTDKLVQGADLLSKDYAFKQAYGEGDRKTLLSAMKSLELRIKAPIILLIDAEEYTVIADINKPEAEDDPEFEFADLIETAEDDPKYQATSLANIDGKLNRLIIVPLMAPCPVAWFCIGFVIDDTLAGRLQSLTLTDVSFLQTEEGKWKALATTLPSERQDCLSQVPQAKPTAGEILNLTSGDENYVALVLEISAAPKVNVVLQRSLNDALAPYRELQATLKFLAAAGLLVCIIGSVIIARGVAKPVKTLVAGTDRVAEGDYEHQVNIEQKDEIGQLAAAFNHMTQGLADRDRVRGLLGKVVSPAIAEELLSKKEVQLGGEERKVTILFSDIRSFTSLSEARTPHEILEFLNMYLTKMSALIEKNGGVIDKYIGDAIMALWGAPVSHDEYIQLAVKTTLEMVQEMNTINEYLTGIGWPEVGIGIGLNTEVVVAGNMGSPNRLNYTVIGDGVNLASRIEGVTKQYGVMVLISEYTNQEISDSYLSREIDAIQVVGKSQPVKIYEPICEKEEATESLQQVARLYETGLEHYRSRNWDEAIYNFTQVLGIQDDKPSKIFIERCEKLSEEPPESGWTGIWEFTKK